MFVCRIEYIQCQYYTYWIYFFKNTLKAIHLNTLIRKWISALVLAKLTWFATNYFKMHINSFTWYTCGLKFLLLWLIKYCEPIKIRVFVECGFFALFNGVQFVDTQVFILSKKHNSFWICFLKIKICWGGLFESPWLLMIPQYFTFLSMLSLHTFSYLFCYVFSKFFMRFFTFVVIEFWCPMYFLQISPQN